MAIISQQENFLLKFRQENSQANMKPIDVSVSKEDCIYIVDFKGDKKSATVKIDLESLREIIQYIDSKVYGLRKDTQKDAHVSRVAQSASFAIQGAQPPISPVMDGLQGMNGPSMFESISGNDQVGGLSDLMNDIAEPRSSGLYNSQADLIIANGIDISSIGD
jgi:hypothetical protein